MRDGAHPGWERPTGRERAGLLGRIALFALLVVLAYVAFRQLTYLVFAPELEVIRPILPEGGLSPGEPVTLGVVVRNRGPLTGASFVVAVSGGVEVEGPTLDVPARDTALIPVRLSLNSGTNPVTLVVFNGWRGVRRLHAFRDLPVRLPVRTVEVDLTSPRVQRGEPVEVALAWSNPGTAPEVVTPVVVFRAEGEGPPLVDEGLGVEVPSGEALRLTHTIDSWPLDAGRYTVEVFLEATGRGRVARGSSPESLEVTEP